MKLVKNNFIFAGKLAFFAGMAFSALSSCSEKNDRLFQKIDSGSSGIHFQNKLQARQDLNAFNFTNFYNGGGVGIGDFNNDGLPDVFFTANQVNSELYLNEGELKFKNITGQSGIKTDRWCNGVSIIDINNDGWDDIYISVASHPAMPLTANLLYINKKTAIPSFDERAAEYGLDFKGYSTQSAFLDFDLDGDLDVFLLNTSPDLSNPSVHRQPVNNGTHPSSGKLFRNDGMKNGHPFFVDVSIAAGINYEGLGLGVTVSDFNNDGYPDIYCSNDFMSNDILYMNQGDGTFINTVKESLPHTSYYGMGVSAADINNDGLSDIFQLDMLPGDNARQKQMLTRHDYDKKEASLREPFSYEMQYMRNTLQLNQGSNGKIQFFGDIGLMSGVAKTDWSWSGIVADLNNDGFKDLFISNGYRKNVTDLDFISSYRDNNMFGSDTYKTENRLKILEKVPEIKLKNYAYLNKDGISFEDVSADWGLDEASYASGAAYADFDNDGDLDLVINNIDEEASLYRNQTVEKSGRVMTKVLFKGMAGNTQGIGVKIKAFFGDSLQYFEHFPTTSYLSTMEKGVFIGVPAGRKIDSMTVIWPGNRFQTLYNSEPGKTLTLSYSDAKEMPDFNRRFENTLFTLTDVKSGFIHQESGYVDFNDHPAIHKMLSHGGPAVAKGDLNGDGLEDIVVGGALNGSKTTLLIQHLSGAFTQKAAPESKDMEVGAIAIFDADNDGDNDMILAAGSCERPFSVKEAYKAQLWLNNGKAVFSLADNFPELIVSAGQVVPFDMDADGDTDLFVAGRQLPGQYPFPPASFLLENKNGIYADVTEKKAPFLKNLGMVTTAVAADVDNDRDQDLLIGGEWMPVSVMINNGKSFQLKSYDNMSGWWQSIAAADFDRDGDMDFILGNEGLNSFYRASSDEPVFMYALDFDKNGKTDPIMGHYLQHKKVPALPRESLNQQMVQFRKKFITYKDYSEALFDDLFSKEELGNALHLQARELRHMYAENKNGTLVFTPLPMESQLAPANNTLIGDFDRDGKLDAIVTGGFFPNEAHQGRQDASRGIFLKGSGNGTFRSVPNYRSGLYLSGDVRHSIFLEKSGLMISFRNNSSWLWHKLNTLTGRK